MLNALRLYKFMSREKTTKLDRKIEKLGLPLIERHIFLCADTRECGCASAEQMKASMKYLKKRLKELKLSPKGGVARTASQCFDICTGGPIAVVYPDGVWYGHCDETALEEIIQRHLIHGEVAEDYLIARSQVLS